MLCMLPDVKTACTNNWLELILHASCLAEKNEGGQCARTTLKNVRTNAFYWGGCSFGGGSPWRWMLEARSKTNQSMGQLVMTFRSLFLSSLLLSPQRKLFCNTLVRLREEGGRCMSDLRWLRVLSSSGFSVYGYFVVVGCYVSKTFMHQCDEASQGNNLSGFAGWWGCAKWLLNNFNIQAGATPRFQYSPVWFQLQCNVCWYDLCALLWSGVKHWSCCIPASLQRRSCPSIVGCSSSQWLLQEVLVLRSSLLNPVSCPRSIRKGPACNK